MLMQFSNDRLENNKKTIIELVNKIERPFDKEAFLNNLDKAMEAEEQNSGYKPSNIKKNVDPNQAFLDKLDKEIEKDKEHPYVPYKDMKKNNNMGRGGYNQDDFLHRF